MVFSLIPTKLSAEFQVSTMPGTGQIVCGGGGGGRVFKPTLVYSLASS